MLVRYYTLTWVLGILVVMLFYVTGILTPLVSIVFGFLTVGTVFIGIIGILPATMAQNNEREIVERRN